MAEKLNRGVKSRNLPPLNVFLQVKMSEEQTKHGICGLENVVNLAKRIKSEFEHLNLIGLMCIGQYGDTSVFPVSFGFFDLVLVIFDKILRFLPICEICEILTLALEIVRNEKGSSC